MKATLLTPLALAAVLVAEVTLAPLLVGPGGGAHAAPQDSPASVHREANHGTEPRRFEAADVARLLASPSAEWRDYAMTWDLTRHAGDDLQRAHLEELEGTPDWVIGRFFLRHQVRSPDLEAVRGYFRALEGRRSAATD